MKDILCILGKIQKVYNQGKSCFHSIWGYAVNAILLEGLLCTSHSTDVQSYKTNSNTTQKSWLMRPNSNKSEASTRSGHKYHLSFRRVKVLNIELLQSWRQFLLFVAFLLLQLLFLSHNVSQNREKDDLLVFGFEAIEQF